MAKITAYYSYQDKNGKHILTVNTPTSRNREFVIDTADFRRSSVTDFLNVMVKSTCSLIFDFQLESFRDMNETSGRKSLHNGAVELASSLAEMLSGLMMLRQTPTSSVTRLMGLHRKLVAVTGTSTLLGIIAEWQDDLQLQPFTFAVEQVEGSIKVLDYSDVQLSATVRLSDGPNVKEVTLRRVCGFDECLLLQLIIDAKAELKRPS